MIKDCPKIKKTNANTRFKSKRVDERAMIATLNDSDSSGSESEDEEIANLCLMARENSRENHESEEVTSKYLLTFSKQYLTQGLLRCP